MIWSLHAGEIAEMHEAVIGLADFKVGVDSEEDLPWDVTAGLLLVRGAGGMVYHFNGTVHDAASRYTTASDPSLVEPIGRMVREAM
jgi:fructose-1,6-bisphosphatase/inositol monophosphatase family enzyme